MRVSTTVVAGGDAGTPIVDPNGQPGRTMPRYAESERRAPARLGSVAMTEVSIGAVPGGSAELRGYLARPSGDGPWPGLVAVHELFGLDEQFRRHCDRLAAAGYLTLGVDLFSDGGPRRCIVATMRSLFRGKGKPVADIDAGRRHLAEAVDCTGKVGIIGFCMGGGFALLCAPRGFDVAAANYGQAPSHPAEHFRDSCPVVASYGGRDPLMLGQSKRVEKG